MSKNSTDISGMRFGKLVAEYKSGTTKNGESVWFCRCDCGNTSEVMIYRLLSGNTKSCGCMKNKIGDITRTHGRSHTRLYNVWISMKARCNNEHDRRYADYGGRGITYCDEWSDFARFEEWAMSNGYDENAAFGECTLDRIDADGNYEPSNCRFVDLTTQANNQRRLKKYEVHGESHTMGEWARIYGMNYQTLSSRIHRSKMTMEEALERAIRHT